MRSQAQVRGVFHSLTHLYTLLNTTVKMVGGNKRRARKNYGSPGSWRSPDSLGLTGSRTHGYRGALFGLNVFPPAPQAHEGH